MTAEMMAGFAAILLSLILSYAPKVKTLWAQQSGQAKRLGMAGALLAVAVCAFLLSCWQPERFVDIVVCSETGALDLAWIYVVALVANQGTYTLTSK